MKLPHILEPLKGRLVSKPLWYIYEVIEAYGIEVAEIKFPPGQKGVYYKDSNNRVILISSMLDQYEKRVTAVHELVHALLHESASILCNFNNTWEGKLEREAMIYTARLLIPEDKLIDMLRMEYSIYDIAEEFYVTEDLVRLAIEDIGKVTGVTF